MTSTNQDNTPQSSDDLRRQQTLKLLTETLISYAQATRLFPPFRRGRAVSPSCIWRWVRQGVRLDDNSIVYLEAIRVAGRHLTTSQAVERFILAQQPLAAPVEENANVVAQQRTSSRRERCSKDALEKLRSKQKAPSRKQEVKRTDHPKGSSGDIGGVS